MFYFDPFSILIMVVGGAISGLAAMWVKGSFARYSQVGARNGMSGAQVADAILRFHHIHDVSIEPTPGELSDHYDPTSKTLRLSEQNFHGRSVAALGVAAHEVGHAIQHAQNYAWLNFRSSMVPVVNFSSRFSMILLMGGMLLMAFMKGAGAFGHTVAIAGVGLFAMTTLFSLITLPVEFDASRRALIALRDGHILDGEELVGARRVLRAAAATYVAAAVTSLMWLLYYAWRLGLIGGRSRD
ncbi:MAG: zinc metallopeptidase [Planctomycetota bacterium]